MNDFAFYFELGWKHIISLDALDHQLFILVLTAIYFIENKKQLLILVTAFTIGHSLTLALSVYNIISFSSGWAEFLIPLTICITALYNLININKQPYYSFHYMMALFFGLVHGLGFANTLRFMLAKSQQITLPLLSFNLGLEAGQILLVIIILLLNFICINKLLLHRKYWIWSLSSLSLIIAGYLCIKQYPTNT